jgi:hypothetical protein
VVTRCGRICLEQRKSTSARSLPVRLSASKRCTTTYGWSVLWSMISVFRSGGSGARTAQKSVRPKSVTHVLGTLCYPCLRAGPG